MTFYKKEFTAAGKTYTFTVFPNYPIIDPIDDYSGVYIFAARNGHKEEIKFLYIGQTEHFGRRMAKHEFDKMKCVMSKGFNCICIHEEKDEKERIQIETDFIKQYNPPCNKQ